MYPAVLYEHIYKTELLIEIEQTLTYAHSKFFFRTNDKNKRALR